MSAANERLEFAPPQPPGQLRSFGLAVLAHLLLLAALTWGVSWKRQTLTLSADAELWAAVPKEAAPKEVEAPPPEPTPIPKFLPKVTLPPPPPPPPPPVEAETAKADIVLAQEKERKRQLELKAVERQEKLKNEKLEKESAAAEKKRRLAEAKEEAQRVEALRQENVKRNLAMARATGATGVAGAVVSPAPATPATPVTPPPPVTPVKPVTPPIAVTPVAPTKPNPAPAIAPVIPGATGAATATGTAAQAAGPSASYGGRLVARIRPNITFAIDIAAITGNPGAEVEVRSAPDGTILSRKLLQSSGIQAWDEAVLKAIDKTETLPRDIDGRVPGHLVFMFRPKD